VVQMLTRRRSAYLLAGIIALAALTRRLRLGKPSDGWSILLCASVALVPILTLFAVSRDTPLHLFVFRYRVVAVPGVALCWALVASRIDSRNLRLLLCLVLAGTSAYGYFTSPLSYRHNYSWKNSLEVIEKAATKDNAPVLICSDLPESDYMRMPTGEAVKDSAVFAPLTYYKLSVPVIGLPRALNDEAIRVGSEFLQDAVQRHEHFLAAAYDPSYKTLEWIAHNAAQTYDVDELGVFDGVKVLEFIQRSPADAGR
jgi:hypothetical protein